MIFKIVHADYYYDGDEPLVEINTLEELLEISRTSGYDIIIECPNDSEEPLEITIFDGYID